MTSIRECYKFVLNDLSDPRVKEWPLMESPWNSIGIALLYLYAVYQYFPAHMANRKAYSLKSFIAVYNITQVIANVLLVYGVATSGWTTNYSLHCQLVDFSENDLAMSMARMVWWAFVTKLVDLVETPIFILRKKKNQVTVLHVYHHVSTFLMTWILVKYGAGGMYTLPIILNGSVHVLMYAYYYLSSLGPKVQNKLKFFKSKLTMIQIIQLIAIVYQQYISFSCKGGLYPLSIISSVIIMGDIILFLNFYVQNYLKKNA